MSHAEILMNVDLPPSGSMENDPSLLHLKKVWVYGCTHFPLSFVGGKVGRLLRKKPNHACPGKVLLMMASLTGPGWSWTALVQRFDDAFNRTKSQLVRVLGIGHDKSENDMQSDFGCWNPERFRGRQNDCNREEGFMSRYNKRRELNDLSMA